MTGHERRQPDSPGEFGDQLKRIRERQGFTQSDVARRAGLTPAAISQIEGGQREPNFSTVVRLAQALNTSPNELMGIKAGETLDPAVRALFRNVQQLDSDDFEKVTAFAAFLAAQKKKKK